MGNLGNSLVQSLGLCIPIVGDTGLIPCQGTKILQRKKRKDISRHTIVKLLKIKIEKEMSARGREETYIKQKGEII